MFKVRKFLWRILGVYYERFLRKIDCTFLKDDPFTTLGIKSYENGATKSRSGNAKIEIGKYCSIAQFTTFIVDGGNHTYSKVTSSPLFDILFSSDELDKKEFKSFFRQKKNIYGGNGVTVAANSAVTKDIPDYTIG